MSDGLAPCFPSPESMSAPPRTSIGPVSGPTEKGAPRRR
jgi:hypothetical protein